jgi:cytochrome b subunit of formate dehydrogenase
MNEMVSGFHVLWNKFSIYTIGHFVGGGVALLLSAISPFASILLFAGFMIYELNEDYHITDQAFKDILEFLLGMYMAAILMLWWWLI